MDYDKKLLAARIEDIFSLCDKYCCARFSDFLDGAEQAIISREIQFPCGFNTLLFGGFNDSEKRILGVFPEWEEADAAAFPIVCLKADAGKDSRLTHRDFLGALMGLGITPAKTGDILVSDGSAYIFLHEDISEYVAGNLHKIGNRNVKIYRIDDPHSIDIRRQYKIIETVCASQRLDAITAAAAKMSRSEAAKLISGGKVKLNHLEVCKPAETVKEDDLLSVRGSGRFIVSGFGAETRKQRLHVTLKKYI